MGYTTDFLGHFTIMPALNPAEVEYLQPSRRAAGGTVQAARTPCPTTLALRTSCPGETPAPRRT